MKIVTFNIRCSWDGDGINSFLHRAGSIARKINGEKPEIVCFQECTDKIYAWLNSALPDYHVIFNQRNADRKGEGMATALRKDTVSLLGLDAFWLSPTPDIPGSRYEEQSNCPRICQCLLLRCEGKIFRVYNTHLDHISDPARKLGIEAVLKRIEEDRAKSAFPFFLLGDFNATPNESPIQTCKEAGLTELTDAVDLTFHNYGKISAPYKIDYIFTDRDTGAKDFTVTPWTEEADGIFLSDHYPIQAEFSL